MSTPLGTANTQMISNFLQGEHHAGLLIGVQLENFIDVIKKVSKDGICEVVSPEEGKNSISIDQIRTLKHSLALKQGSQQRLVIINKAELMTHEAQNSFLKLLEEPTSSIHFLLLAQSKGALLRTITSRTQIMQVRPLSLNEAIAHYTEKGMSESDIQKHYTLSKGSPGKLHELFEDSNTYKDAIDHAKKLLKSSTYERLTEVEPLSKDRAYLEQVLLALDDVLRAVIKNASINSTKAKQFAATRKQIFHAVNSLRANGNAKLITLDVFLSL